MTASRSDSSNGTPSASRLANTCASDWPSTNSMIRYAVPFDRKYSRHDTILGWLWNWIRARASSRNRFSPSS